MEAVDHRGPGAKASTASGDPGCSTPVDHGGGELHGSPAPDPRSVRVLSVDLVQSKSRWLGSEVGYVASGLRLRKRLLRAVELYQGKGLQVLFTTFTFDPKLWPGGEAAAADCWTAISRDRIWGEFLRRFDEKFPGRHVVAVQEPHGGGGPHHAWPHFHALIIGPRGKIPFDKVKPLWGWGRMDGSRAGMGAANYICKYITKGPPEIAFHDSLSPYTHLIHSTHGFWDILEEDKPVPDPERVIVHREPGPATVGEIRRDRGKYLGTIFKALVCNARGELLTVCRHVKHNVSMIVDTINEHGFLGGYDAGFGRGSFSLGTEWLAGPAAAKPLTLDYLVNCGSAEHSVEPSLALSG